MQTGYVKTLTFQTSPLLNIKSALLI